MVHTPFQRIETRNYLANGAGGFDVRDCPDATELATFINRACNSHDDLVKALGDLHAIVWGECPSLLNEDSGGDAYLDMRIRELLSKIGRAHV